MHCAGSAEAVAQHLFDFGRREVPPARLDHDSDEPSDHLPEEMGTDDPKDDQIAPDRDFGPVDLHLGGEVLVDSPVGKGGEIVESPEDLRSRLHAAEVEVILHPPDVPFAKGRPHARDQVEIASLPGRVAGMEILSAPLRP